MACRSENAPQNPVVNDSRHDSRRRPRRFGIGDGFLRFHAVAAEPWFS
jgi:hypothetical protein